MFSFILFPYIYKQRYHLSWLRAILENIGLPSKVLSQWKRSISCNNFFVMATCNTPLGKTQDLNQQIFQKRLPLQTFV